MHLDENFWNKFQIFSGFWLKILAMMAMLIDHIGALLFPQYLVLRIIGRLAFPIYCFLLVEGAIYTKNIKKYSARLLFFALISEIPFDLAFKGQVIEFQHQNVFFTLFLGLTGIMICKKWSRVWWLSFLMLVVAELLHTDYGAMGVLFVLMFYLLRENKLHKMIFYVLTTLVAYRGTTQTYSCFAIFPLLLYNGKRGYNIKYFFYVFYPLHLLVLYFISILQLTN